MESDASRGSIRVLITGGSGFVGLALAQSLLERGVQVCLFDRRPPPAAFLSAIQALKGNLQVLQGDVCTDADVREACSGGITHVFHGAAITAGPEREVAQTLQIIEVNVQGALRVLRAAADAGVKRFVYPSSLTVYGDAIHGRAPLTESGTAPAPDTLYGITKYAAECAVLRLGQLIGLPVCVGRIGSVFGPWEGETGARDMVSPFAQIAAAAARDEPVVLPGQYPSREMIYAPDLSAGLMALLFAMRPAHPYYNLSANFDWDDALIRWCETLAACLPDFNWRYAEAGYPSTISFHGARPRVSMNASRARDDLGFRPSFARDDALKHYADWVAGHTKFFAHCA